MFADLIEKERTFYTVYYGKGLFNLLDFGILCHLDFTFARSTLLVLVEIQVQSFLFLSITVQQTTDQEPLLT